MKRAFAIPIMCCAFVLALGLVACGGSSSGSTASSAASGSASTASASGDSGGSSTASADAETAGYLDEYGLMTAKALIELDGAELTELAKTANYNWDEKHAEWTTFGSDVAPSKGLTSEEMQASDGIEAFEFSADEVAAFAKGAKGTPVVWYVTSKAKYDDVNQFLAAQQVTVVDQCEVEHRNYGKEIWSIVENSSGDRFLLCAKHYSGKSAFDLFTEDYIAINSRGVASSFNLGDYLLEDAHTIDDIWPILQSGEVS